MEALKNLTNNIPDWQRRLDELSGQIDRRQTVLAAISPQDPNPSVARSLRNKGSSESLTQKDEAAMAMGSHDAAVLSPQPEQRQTVDIPLPAALPFPVSRETGHRLALHKQAREAALAAQSQARAQAGKIRRSSSMASAESPPTTYRTRSIIIVYYDSYVQAFFDELVRFVSSNRNLIRKARMAAMVAQVRQIAEMEMADDEKNPDGDDNRTSDGLPSLRYISTRRLPAMSASGRSEIRGLGGDVQLPDIYEKLDKTLDFVQCTCEHGAHKFLRDADCNKELNKIRARMNDVLVASRKEMQRVQREDPGLSKYLGDVGMPQARLPSITRGEVPK
ncbi:hypothetical protein O9K51_10992 [Purpureocillium lavendulum]|uniref:Uncharacterized protein n=1 Tax=Purpureocillium lavendulum TaxID=1247861 RepID=A0AB34FAZ6_9HYPO|nr:hypothetical protein O9K51_10992 [Purpureocillium lavendulum]